MNELEVLREEPRAVAVPGELTVAGLVEQVRKIQEVMAAVMRDGEHYGVIPGTPKPTLLKPGAEKLCLLFRLDPQYEVSQARDGDHLTVLAKATLWHIPTGERRGSGFGSCSTREGRYAYREAKRSCPACGVAAIIKGKVEYGGGWVCFKKQGGCGAKYPDLDAAITGQPSGRVSNPDLADQWNTVLKMACKRALVAATLNVTAASDIYTQDIEDLPPGAIQVDAVKTEPPGNGKAKAEPRPREVPLEEVRSSEGAEEWVAAFERAGSMENLKSLWDTLVGPEMWARYTTADRALIVAAKDAAKARLTPTP